MLEAAGKLVELICVKANAIIYGCKDGAGSLKPGRLNRVLYIGIIASVYARH